VCAITAFKIQGGFVYGPVLLARVDARASQIVCSLLGRQLRAWLVALGVLLSSVSAFAQAPAAPPQAPAPAPAQPPAVAPAPPPAQYVVPPAQYVPPPPPGYAPSYPGSAYRPAAPRPHVSKGLMITGIAVLGGSYLIAALTGAILIDDNDCRDCRDVGALLFIPVAGPFAAIGPAEDGRGVLALFGVVQLAGLGMMIGGIVRYVHTKHAVEQSGYYGWRLPGRRPLQLDFGAGAAPLAPALALRF
jgi:hypothetical protein